MLFEEADVRFVRTRDDLEQTYEIRHPRDRCWQTLDALSNLFRRDGPTGTRLMLVRNDRLDARPPLLLLESHSAHFG